MALAYQSEFIDLCVQLGVLRFGSFTLKSGRESPYFFNAGLFNTGRRDRRGGARLRGRGRGLDLKFDMLFGPPKRHSSGDHYRGGPSERHARNTPFAFNRKEAKDHGEVARSWGPRCRAES